MEKWTSLIFLLVVADVMTALNVCLMCHIEEDLRMHIGSTLTQRLAINAVLMTFAVRVINARALILGGGVAEAYTERAEDTTMQ